MGKKQPHMIRNSTAEFLIFAQQSGEDSIEVRYENETIWITQKQMTELFSVTIPTVNEQLKNIFNPEELQPDSVIAKDHAENEFDKYRIIQDRLFESGLIKKLNLLTNRLQRKHE